MPTVVIVANGNGEIRNPGSGIPGWEGTLVVLAESEFGQEECRVYGAIVVDPKTPLPYADRRYVLVSSEWYLNASGLDAPRRSTWPRRTRWRPTG
jgi:FtsP/CotA-like multicopper oxidase with cupredoxin domain